MRLQHNKKIDLLFKIHLLLNAFHVIIILRVRTCKCIVLRIGECESGDKQSLICSMSNGSLVTMVENIASM